MSLTVKDCLEGPKPSPRQRTPLAEDAINGPKDKMAEDVLSATEGPSGLIGLDIPPDRL